MATNYASNATLASFHQWLCFAQASRTDEISKRTKLMLIVRMLDSRATATSFQRWRGEVDGILAAEASLETRKTRLVKMVSRKLAMALRLAFLRLKQASVAEAKLQHLREAAAKKIVLMVSLPSARA